MSQRFQNYQIVQKCLLIELLHNMKHGHAWHHNSDCEDLEKAKGKDGKDYTEVQTAQKEVENAKKLRDEALTEVKSLREEVNSAKAKKAQALMDQKKTLTESWMTERQSLERQNAILRESNTTLKTAAKADHKRLSKYD
ncbi:uncharacterized protein PAC_18245 [Phialocephala subalpina]|uniref:Uncharacterized protein n=1 Tax=Phialocephala subalpina TaxID=576137 RepID=A0A1L7XTJ4_9HELO|nr:uncharacterized protein PAC_18245 [Phialocephala subalpina]